MSEAIAGIVFKELETYPDQRGFFRVTSHTYNPDDELRIAYDSPEIEFDWLKGPPIK